MLIGKGLLHRYLSGQAGAGALLDIITGKINPSGKLNETLPVKYEDVPSYNYSPSKERTSEYREGIFVGYRYYDTANSTCKISIWIWTYHIQHLNIQI